MKRYMLIALLTLIVGITAAVSVETFDTRGNGLTASLRNLRQAPIEPETEEDEFDTQTFISRTFALPFADVILRITNTRWNAFDLTGNYIGEVQHRNNDAAVIANRFRFREMQGFTVNIRTQIEEENRILTLMDVDFELEGIGSIELPMSVSPAFIDAYKVLADNYETSYLRNLPTSRPKMLIISHANLANFQTDFIKWKRSVGFDVFVVNRADIGSSVNEIKAFLVTHFQQYRCDYLLLLGDVTGSYSIPTAFYPSPEYAENDADDFQYTLLEGDDYFPEMLVGRFSFNDIAEFMTMANKTVVYERQPFMSDTNWMRRGLVVAGNYAEGGLRPTTPVHMSRWLRNKMLDHGYAQVDSVFYPPTFPGTTAIQTAINQGVQYISYRGWGDANGWHYPYFHTADLNSTFNGQRMPIVFSIVCNTGDFANSVNPSFGEKWMRMGSVAQPGGCVAFVGPSDLHTKTRFNNSISSGAFRSIFDYGVRGFGSSVLMGKMELYKNFPNDIAPNQYVPFYFHVYNLLSDPSMNMWVLVPNTISENIIEGGLNYAQSASHIRINAPHLEDAMVSGTKNGNTYTYTKVTNGVAILPIDPEESGNLIVTVSKPNFVPLVRTMNPTGTTTMGIVSNDVAGTTLHPGHTQNANITIKNFTDSAVNVSTLGITADQHATINYQHTAFNLAAGATRDIAFQITGTDEITPREPITFTVTAPGMSQVFQMWGGGAEFSIVSATGTLGIGQTSTVNFTIINTGVTALTNASVRTVSLTEAALFPGAPINLGNIAPGETKNFSQTITVASGAWNGRNLPMKLILSQGEYETLAFYALTAGTPSTTSPTGPDSYGYYAYDSFDTGFAQTPTYNWVEIDPLLGGQGDVFLVLDDGSRTVNLPFTFRFYGRDYNHVTMCSNGWISLLPTDMFDFFNHYIPAALGPYTMIAGYWDDLKGMKTGVDGQGNGIFNNMRVLYWHDVANNRYIVQWNDAYNQYNIDMMENASLEKFQIILYPQTGRDGDIVIQYHTVDNPGITTNYCTVGIENHTQTVGLTYTHGNVYPATATPLQAGLAIKFTTIAPDSYVSNDDPIQAPAVKLLQNYPNPFNPTTTISFSTPASGNASLAIYNMKGQLVRTLMNQNVNAGSHNVVWNGLDDQGRSVSSGLYMYRLNINGESQQKKMLLMK